jgi:hypothetical protein
VKWSRGAALPETAVVLGVALTLIFGTFELGLIGFTQLSSDGAAFVAAHASVLGNDPNAAIAAPFPHIPSGALSIKPIQPGTTDLPVDYQDSTAAQQTNRHGGVQVVLPSRLQASVAQDGVGIGGYLPKTTIGSGVIEANMVVTNQGFDIWGNDVNSQSAFDKRLGYFQDDGNAPPYFIGFKIMKDCMDVAVGAGCTNAQMRSLGLAEYLDADNWARQQNGIGPNGVFEAMLKHQHAYAQLSQEIDTFYQGGRTTKTSDPAANAFLPAGDACITTVQGWDTAGGGSGFNWRLNPLNPLYEAPGC